MTLSIFSSNNGRGDLTSGLASGLRSVKSGPGEECARDAEKCKEKQNREFGRQNVAKESAV